MINDRPINWQLSRQRVPPLVKTQYSALAPDMLGFPRDIKVGISNTRYAVVWGCLGRLSREAGGPQ